MGRGLTRERKRKKRSQREANRERVESLFFSRERSSRKEREVAGGGRGAEMGRRRLPFESEKVRTLEEGGEDEEGGHRNTR